MAKNVTPRHILKLSSEEKRKFLDSFDYVFSDIDGVIWNLKESIKGAPEGFKVLQNAGKHLNFITNNSLTPMEKIEAKFKAHGLDIKQDDIWHPAKSIVVYLQSIKFDGMLYVVATEVYKNIIREAGFNVLDGPNKILQESFTDLAQYLFDKKPVKAVIMDVDFNLSAVKMIRAQQYLNHADCLLIAGASDMKINVSESVNIIGPGPYLKVLEEATGKTALKLGKPGKTLAEMLTSHFGITDHHRVLMIGDTLEQDIGFAKACNFQSLLVLSGCCKLGDLEDPSNADMLPDYYADGVLDFVELAKDLQKSNV